MKSLFDERLSDIKKHHNKILQYKNEVLFSIHGLYQRYRYPVITAEHIPLEWRFDLNPESNPRLLERLCKIHHRSNHPRGKLNAYHKHLYQDLPSQA